MLNCIFYSWFIYNYKGGVMGKENIKILLQVIFLIIIMVVAILIGIGVDILGILRDIKIISM